MCSVGAAGAGAAGAGAAAAASFKIALWPYNLPLVKVAISSIVLETDDALHTDIKQVYRKASKLKNIGVEELQQKIKQNFKNIFKKWVG